MEQSPREHLVCLAQHPPNKSKVNLEGGGNFWVVEFNRVHREGGMMVIYCTKSSSPPPPQRPRAYACADHEREKVCVSVW